MSPDELKAIVTCYLGIISHLRSKIEFVALLDRKCFGPMADKVFNDMPFIGRYGFPTYMVEDIIVEWARDRAQRSV